MVAIVVTALIQLKLIISVFLLLVSIFVFTLSLHINLDFK